jgi:hypothetical protein
VELGVTYVSLRGNILSILQACKSELNKIGLLHVFLSGNMCIWYFCKPRGGCLPRLLILSPSRSHQTRICRKQPNFWGGAGQLQNRDRNVKSHFGLRGVLQKLYCTVMGETNRWLRLKGHSHLGDVQLSDRGSNWCLWICSFCHYLAMMIGELLSHFRSCFSACGLEQSKGSGVLVFTHAHVYVQRSDKQVLTQMSSKLPLMPFNTTS